MSLLKPKLTPSMLISIYECLVILLSLLVVGTLLPYPNIPGRFWGALVILVVYGCCIYGCLWEIGEAGNPTGCYSNKSVDSGKHPRVK